MQNGKNLSIDEAKGIILKFEDLETSAPRNTPIDDLAIGHKIDLHLLRSFLGAIDTHAHGAEIDAVRIYLGRSVRPGLTVEHFDIVMVPVLRPDAQGKDYDLHKVYDKDDDREVLPTLIGNSLPCPNVCPNGTALYCP